MVHYLRTLPEYFQAVKAGTKKFEIRKDDRGFSCGDVLILREFDVQNNLYSGEHLRKRVSYILRGEPYLSGGYCCMSLAD